MSDELVHLRRQVDGLLESYGAVMQSEIRLEERVTTAAEDRKAIRAEQREIRQELLATIARAEGRLLARIDDVEEECKEFRDEARGWHHEDNRRREAALEGRVSNRTIVLAMITGAAAILAALISAAAVIITGGG